MSNKDNGYFLNLTGCDKTVINLRVTDKAELEKARELFSKLSKLANKALKSSKTASAFFRILEYEVESFDEFIEFFDVSPVGLAAGMTQMRFHEMAVDNWDTIGATIDAKGEQGGRYKLPPPTMMLVLRSKGYQKENGDIIMNDSLDKYGEDMAGISEIGYIYSDDEALAIEALENYVPKNVLHKAVGAVTLALKESVNQAMVKLMKRCEYGTNESSSKEPEDIKGEFARQKIQDILSGLEGDDFFNALGKILRNDTMRSFIQKDFDKWCKNEGSENMMPMPGEIHGEA